MMLPYANDRPSNDCAPALILTCHRDGHPGAIRASVGFGPLPKVGPGRLGNSGLVRGSAGRFARTVRRDLDAVTNALTEGWTNGQTEGHINRLKPLKRAMYGRAGPELLRARMLPLHSPFEHGK
jgi:hypothetical protein